MQASACPVLVTRPEGEAEAWGQQLQSQGVAAEVLSLIAIGPWGNQADVARAWGLLARADCAAVLFVSRSAVRHFFKPNSPAAQVNPAAAAINFVAHQLPAALRFLAPGPGTAAELLAHGVPAAQIDTPAVDAQQFDSQALWGVVGQRDWRGSQVLLVGGVSLQEGRAVGTGQARSWLTQQFEHAGAGVHTLDVYARQCPLLDAAQIARATRAQTDASVWLFSSSEALANLLAQPALGAADWSCALAVATHPRIAQAVRAAGWGQVADARPTVLEVIRAVRSIESKPP
jgi:uroporphyrinogen-III synthase